MKNKIAWTKIPRGSQLVMWEGRKLTFIRKLTSPYLYVISDKGMFSTVTESMVKYVRLPERV